MLKPLIAAAVFAAVIPVSAHAADTARQLRIEPDRGISVVPLKGANKDSGKAQLFVVRPPEGTTPSGGTETADKGKNHFIVRPPAGTTPQGTQTADNDPRPGTSFLVRPPLGIPLTDANPGHTALPIIVAPQADRIADPAPTSIAQADDDEEDADTLADGDDDAVSGDDEDDDAVSGDDDGGDDVAETPDETAPADTGDGRITIQGVDNASDLYQTLVHGGFSVEVRDAGHDGLYLFIVRKARWPFAQVLLVDRDGAVLKQQTVRTAGYGYPQRRSHVQVYRPAAEFCHPADTRQSAYAHGRARWAHY